MTAIVKTTRAKLDQCADELDRRLTALLTACPYDVTVNNSWRSSAKQAELYARYLAGTGNLAAKPGRSRHERVHGGKPAAEAADLRYPGGKGTQLYKDAVAWIHEHAPSYGLHFPVRGENWHIECTRHEPVVTIKTIAAPARPKTNVPPGRDPLLGLQNPRLYGPKVADVHRVLLELADGNRALLGEEVELQVYGPKTAKLMTVYKDHRGLGAERGVTPAVWAALRKDKRR